jgi:hypothetical protein
MADEAGCRGWVILQASASGMPNLVSLAVPIDDAKYYELVRQHR